MIIWEILVKSERNRQFFFHYTPKDLKFFWILKILFKLHLIMKFKYFYFIIFFKIVILVWFEIKSELFYFRLFLFPFLLCFIFIFKEISLFFASHRYFIKNLFFYFWIYWNLFFYILNLQFSIINAFKNELFIEKRFK